MPKKNLNKRLERMKAIEEEILLIRQTEDAPKYIIFVDKGYAELKESLKSLGHSTGIVPEFIDFPKAERGYQKHKWLNSKRKEAGDIPIILITSRYMDYLQYDTRDYSIFDITEPYPTEKLANKISEAIRKYRLIAQTIYSI